MRYAIYFTPNKNSELTALAASWLGRSIYSPSDSFPDHAFKKLTSFPRKYGFHGTLKAPFRPIKEQSQDVLVAALASFAAQRSPFEIPKSHISRLGAFFALVPDKQIHELSDLAGDVVAEFEPFRTPLTAEDYRRRKPETLTIVQREMLDRWGYPYVFDEFRFHMTLTGPVEEALAAAASDALQGHFASILNSAIAVDRLSLFVEPEPGAAFQLLAQFPFGDTKIEWITK